MSRVFWLSFADADQPEGKGFLGVSIIEVTEEEARAMLPRLPAGHLPEAEWPAAAARKAWTLCCNPGGQMLAIEMTDHLHEIPADTPFGRLMLFPELKARGL